MHRAVPFFLEQILLCQAKRQLIQPDELNFDRLLKVTGGSFDPSKTLHLLRIAIAAGRARVVPPARRDRPPRPPLAEGARRAAHVCTTGCAELLDPELEPEREPAGRAHAVTPARRDRPPRPALTEGARRAADLKRLQLPPGPDLDSRSACQPRCLPHMCRTARALRRRRQGSRRCLRRLPRRAAFDFLIGLLVCHPPIRWLSLAYL